MKILLGGMAVLLAVLLVAPAYSHTDLDLQVEELTRQLEQQPDSVYLLLGRGDLQRRHENRDLALADFKQVREIQPGNTLVDWFEGRLQVETGFPEQGVLLLDRFLLINPHHTIALQNRARGYLLLDQPLLAAQDFRTVIRVSDTSTPSLYSATALALVQAGEEHFPEAMDVVRDGLGRFPVEISLTGIGVDISLASRDIETASTFISQLPPSVQNLQQWQFRQALLDCQAGRGDQATKWFSNAIETRPGFSHAQPRLSTERLESLAADPGTSNCQTAALEVLEK